jgi:hypothetical protein
MPDHVTNNFSSRKKRRNARHVRPEKPRNARRRSPPQGKDLRPQMTNPIIRNPPPPKRPIKRAKKRKREGKRESASPDANSTDPDVEATTVHVVTPVVHAVGTTVVLEEMTTVSQESLVNSGNHVNLANLVNNVVIAVIDRALGVDSDREAPRAAPRAAPALGLASLEVSDEWRAEVAEIASREAEVKRDPPRESLVQTLPQTPIENLMPRVRTCFLLWVTKMTIKLFPL